ncbi:tetratricopeptide repeat protein, partial [Dokdonella sp.]|uniref:tetratricopeptide repeat protein n=1 Tax=Dokdonella sp. TaxID=2291710 RepID=UPI003C395E26
MTLKVNAAVSGLIQAMVLALVMFSGGLAQADQSATPTALPDASKVAQATARLTEDPAEAMATLRALWDDPREPDASAAAVALVTAMAKGGYPGELADLCEAMLDSGRLRPGDAPEVFSKWLPSLMASKRWPDDESAMRNRAQAISDAAPEGKGRSLPWMSIGVAEIGFGKFAQAESAIRTAIDLQADQPPSEHLKSSQSNLGVALAQQGKMDEALGAFLASEATREAMGLPEEAGMLGNLASLYVYLKRWDQAISYSRRAIAASEPETARRASFINTLGSGLFGLGDLDGARAAFEENLSIGERIGAPTTSALNNLA